MNSTQSKIFNGVQAGVFFGVAVLAGVKYRNWSGALLTATIGSGALLATTSKNESKLSRFLRTVGCIAFGSLITHVSSKLLKGKITTKLSENVKALALNSALAVGTTLLLKANTKQLPPPKSAAEEKREALMKRHELCQGDHDKLTTTDAHDFLLADLPFIQTEFDMIDYDFIWKFLEDHESILGNQQVWIVNSASFNNNLSFSLNAEFHLNHSLNKHGLPMQWYADVTHHGAPNFRYRLTKEKIEFAAGKEQYENLLRDVFLKDPIAYVEFSEVLKREIPELFEGFTPPASLEEHLEQYGVQHLKNCQLFTLSKYVDLDELSIERQVELITLWKNEKIIGECQNKALKSLTLDHFEKSEELLKFYHFMSVKHPREFFKYVNEAKIVEFNAANLELLENRKIRYLKDYSAEEIKKFTRTQFLYWNSLFPQDQGQITSQWTQGLSEEQKYAVLFLRDKEMNSPFWK